VQCPLHFIPHLAALFGFVPKIGNSIADLDGILCAIFLEQGIFPLKGALILKRGLNKEIKAHLIFLQALKTQGFK